MILTFLFHSLKYFSFHLSVKLLKFSKLNESMNVIWHDHRNPGTVLGVFPDDTLIRLA